MKLQQNFKYPEIKDTDYHFGSGQITGNILRLNGDWRPYTPPDESQRKQFDPSTCFIQASQHTIATIFEEQYNMPDQDFSERFNLIYSSSASTSGGDPLDGAQTFRDYGLIPDSLLPFSSTVANWEQFRSFFGGDRDVCVKTGKDWRAKWEPKYDVVVRREMDIKTKYDLMKNALKYSPLPMSVAQGYNNGQSKPQGLGDIHTVELVYIDGDNAPYIWDTYPPYLKKLAPNYNTDFAMRYTLDRNTTMQEIGLMERVVNLLKSIIQAISGPRIVPVLTSTPNVPVVEPNVPKYLWGTKEQSKHSVRVIADEERLTVPDKNALCATIGAESNWNIKAVSKPNSNGTRDWGIVQVNDGIWIGQGKKFPSTEYVLTHPVECVRWMCYQWKAGNKDWWYGWKNGNYKAYL